jgi:fructokinase
VIGGSVGGLPGLLPLVRANLAQALAGYPGLSEHAADNFIVPAALGSLAGPAGGLVLADHASQSASQSASQPKV